MYIIVSAGVMVGTGGGASRVMGGEGWRSGGSDRVGVTGVGWRGANSGVMMVFLLGV